MPAPQTSALLNSFDSGIAELTSQAHMKPCITLLATFDTPQDINFDAAFVNSEIISWIAKNNSKPNRSGLETWTIHTKPEWSEQFIDADNNVVTKLIIEAAQALGLDCEKAQLMIHRWRYANGHIPTVPQFHLDSDAQLGLCGDWLHGGRVEGAWLSGYKLANAIAIPSP
jgi:predicted NAD/FAD-dependent oxidoreductase